MQPDQEKNYFVDVKQSVCSFSHANSKLTLWNFKMEYVFSDTPTVAMATSIKQQNPMKLFRL